MKGGGGQKSYTVIEPQQKINSHFTDWGSPPPGPRPALRKVPQVCLPSFPLRGRDPQHVISLFRPTIKKT